MKKADSRNASPTQQAMQLSQQVVFWIKFCVFVDMFGVALVVPLLTTYFREAGVNTEMVGYISSLYYFCQLIGGVAIGSLSDVIPRRDVIMLSFAGSAVSYLIVGWTSKIWILFATRAMVGLVKQTMTISTSMIAEHGHIDSRASSIAALSAASTLAFIIGPAVGSFLYKIDPQYPTVMSASLFICNIGVCYLKIPRYCNQLDEIKLEPVSISDEKIDPNHPFHWVVRVYDQLMSSVHVKGIFLNLVALFSISFVDRAMNFNNMISFFEIRFGVEAYTLGYIASATAVITLLAQTFFVDRTKSYLGSDQRAIVVGLVVASFSSLIEYFCPSIYHYLLLVVPLSALSSSVVSACSKSALSASVPAEHLGKLFGALNVMDAIAGVVAPIYGAELFTKTGYVLRSIVVAVHYFVLSGWIQLVLLHDRATDTDEKKERLKD